MMLAQARPGYSSYERVSAVVGARDVLAEPDLAVSYEDVNMFLAVEHQAHECWPLEDDAAVHGRLAPCRLLHQNADDTVAPLAAISCSITIQS